MPKYLAQSSAAPRGVATGDMDAGQLYRRHHPWLVGWLRRKLANGQDAADVSHDTFLRLLSLDDLDTLREPRAYLLVIASRLLINRYRRDRVENEALRQVAILMRTVEERTPAEIVAARSLLRRLLLMLAEELPDRVRRAFLLSRVDGLSYAQIADRLGVSESSVKQYLARALVHCHKRFHAEYRELPR